MTLGRGHTLGRGQTVGRGKTVERGHTGKKADCRLKASFEESADCRGRHPVGKGQPVRQSVQRKLGRRQTAGWRRD